MSARGKATAARVLLKGFKNRSEYVWEFCPSSDMFSGTEISGVAIKLEKVSVEERVGREDFNCKAEICRHAGQKPFQRRQL